MTRKERKMVRRRRFPLGMGILLTCLAIILGSNSATLARYLLKYETGNGSIIASDFYFTGDPSLTTEINEVVDPELGERISFYNYDRDNESLITLRDIDYTTTVTYYNGNDPMGAPISSRDSLIGGVKSTGTIELAYKTDATHAIVTVQSIAPYRKTMSAQFNFVASSWEKVAQLDIQEISETATYTVEDKGDYVNLIIVTGDMAIPELPISWDENHLVPDTTHQLMSSWESTSRKETISLDANCTETLRFFKYDPSILYSMVEATISMLGIRITNTIS